MKRAIPITALFLDIGGVLLTNGWDHHARKQIAANFELELAEYEGNCTPAEKMACIQARQAADTNGRRIGKIQYPKITRAVFSPAR
jgi:hypothetical protein